MSRPEWSIKSVQPREDYTLLIDFANGEVKVFDVKPLLALPVYSKLRSKHFFMTARLFGSSVAWGRDIDIAPERLYELGRPLAGTS